MNRETSVVGFTLSVLALMAVIVRCGADPTAECKVKAPDGKVYKCDPEAVEKCDELLATYCNEVTDCAWFVSESQCEADAAALVNCSAAEAVADSYYGCLDDIHAFDCVALKGALPSSCNGAVLVTGKGGSASYADAVLSDEAQTGTPDTVTPSDGGKEYEVSSLSVAVTKYASNGDSWDVLGGAPDIFAGIYLDGDVLGTTGTEQDTFDASWQTLGFSGKFAQASRLEIRLRDKDIAVSDSIADVVIDGDALATLLEDGTLELSNPTDTVESLSIQVQAL